MAKTKTVTEQDLKDNPSWEAKGILVGDEIPTTEAGAENKQDGEDSTDNASEAGAETTASVTTATVTNQISETESGLVITTERLTTATLPPTQNPNDVVFKVKYKKGYEGEKNMPEGNVIVSKESADHFESLGIGSIVK